MNIKRLAHPRTIRFAHFAWVPFIALSCNAPEIHIASFEFEGPANSSIPNLSVDPNGRIVASWVESRDDHHVLAAARRVDGAWLAPTEIAAGSSFFVNWADFPSVTILPGDQWVAHWLDRSSSERYAYGVRVATSSDGTIWSSPRWLHDDRSPVEHGFVSIASDQGRAGALWLDGRNTGGHGAGDESTSRAMQLRFNVLNADGTFGTEMLVDDRVCDCCQTAMIQTSGGLVAAYRDRSEMEVRDIAVVRLEPEGWTEPVHVGEDGWVHPACPVNGPALASIDQTVVVTWYTAPNDLAEVQAAFSHDYGDTWGGPIKVNVGVPLGRVGVAMLDAERAVVTWMERTSDSTASVMARIVEQNGTAGPASAVLTTDAARAAGFPRLVGSRDGFFLAWSDLERKTIRVARLGGLEYP